MPLFRKTRFYLISEPLRGVFLASYLKAGGRDVSYPSPNFFKSKDSEKIPFFPLFLPSQEEKEISFNRVKLEGCLQEGEERFSIAIGESIRIRGFVEEELILDEFKREFGEKSFVETCYFICKEMRNFYTRGKKEKAREKWENLKEWLGKLNEEEKNIIKTIFTSWTFITHKFEQKKAEDGAFPFLAGFQKLKYIGSPEKLWSRTVNLFNFYQLEKPSYSQLVEPSQLPDEDKGLCTRKKIWILKCETSKIPEEMKNPLIYKEKPLSEPIYVEMLPSTPETSSFLLFSDVNSSEEILKKAIKTIAPLLDEPINLSPIGEEDFFYLSDFVPKKVIPLIPSVPSHISTDLLFMEKEIKK